MESAEIMKPGVLRSFAFASQEIPHQNIPTAVIGISFPVAEYDHISTDKQGIWSLQIMRDETINYLRFKFILGVHYGSSVETEHVPGQDYSR